MSSKQRRPRMLLAVAIVVGIAVIAVLFRVPDLVKRHLLVSRLAGSYGDFGACVLDTAYSTEFDPIPVGEANNGDESLEFEDRFNAIAAAAQRFAEDARAAVRTAGVDHHGRDRPSSL